MIIKSKTKNAHNVEFAEEVFQLVDFVTTCAVFLLAEDLLVRCLAL